IRNIGGPDGDPAGASWTFAADRLSNLAYDPDQTAHPGLEAPAPRHPDARPPRQVWGVGVGDRSEPLQVIGEHLYDIDRVAKAIEAYRLRKQPLDAPVDVAPSSTLQAALLNIWSRVLGRRIGIHDNFFDVGGTSLRAVQVIGAGNIGSGVVTDLVLHGISAVVVDISQDILKRAQAAVLNNVRCVPLLSKTLPRVTPEDALQRMVFTTDLQDVASCDFIIENVTEDWHVKKPVYEQLDRVAPREVCFGVNTSCILIM